MKKAWCLALVLPALVMLAFVIPVLGGCVFSDQKEEKASVSTLTLMTWNVHNLFDGKDNGFEYDEFREAGGWSEEKYFGRINTLSAAIGTIEPLPDIIVLQEIESLKILEDLALAVSSTAKSFAGAKGAYVSAQKSYSWCYFANNSGAALGLGILSRLPLADIKVHSITVNGDTAPRPILETRVDTAAGSFVLFACHWKSKLGSDDATEKNRRASARVLLRRMREIWENEPELGIIVAGDLNENHDDFYRRDANEICALLPDDPLSAQLAGQQKDFIVIGKNKPPLPVHFPLETIVLFSPWMQDLYSSDREFGSYFYRNSWETIDHFLVSAQFFNNTGWEYESTIVIDRQPFTGSRGTPVSYNARTGSGLSDHLPLLLGIKMISE